MVIDRFGGEDENYILYLLEIHKRMSNSDLCRALNLSTSTVRKKLAKMEEEGLLIRTYGGAASLDADRDETIGRKSQMNIQQKRMIAAAASRFVRDGETISLGGGSTNTNKSKMYSAFPLKHHPAHGAELQKNE